MIATLLLLSGMDVVTHKNLNIDLSTAKKATVVAFVSAKCPCSASHEAKLKSLAGEYTKNGFNFVGVHSNADEDEAMTSTHFKASSFPFPVIQDKDTKIANEYSALKTPHVFVVKNNGEILYQGGVDDSHRAHEAKTNYLEQALAAINAGKAPEVKISKSLGCAIKR